MRGLRRLLTPAAFGLWLFALGLPGAAAAQDKAATLADMRAELAQIAGDLTMLRQELITSGALQSGAAGGDALQRMDAIEAALTRLTAKAEELELRVNKVVADGTNRLGDLEFRLCEMTEGCDVAALPPTAPLGGGAGAALPPPAPGSGLVLGASPPSGTGGELAVGEQADFDRAKGVLGQGDFRTAADLFQTFTTTYQGGPLSQEAHLLRGQALAQLGDTPNAARAYLEAFSGAPDGALAGQALLRLSGALGELGQVPEACVTLSEVGARFPASPEAGEAQALAQSLGCQ